MQRKDISPPEMVLESPRKGIKLTYTTDTRPTDSIRKNAKDSDLFIAKECTVKKKGSKKQWNISI